MVAASEENILAPAFHSRLLFGCQCVCSVAVVDNLGCGLERDASVGEIILAYMCDTSIDVVVPVPGCVHSPVYTIFLPFRRDIKRNNHVGGLHCHHEVGSCLS